MGPIELEDRWILGLRGSRVVKISVDFRLALTLDSGWDVAIEGPALLSYGSALTNSCQRLTPHAQDVAAALQLFQASVVSAVAFKTGSLRLVFDTGVHLNCPVDPVCEAWHVSGPRGRRYVSLPGGGVAVWPERHDNQPLTPTTGHEH